MDAASAAGAAHMVTSTHRTEALLISILIQLVIMIGAARLANLAFRRLGQPGSVGEIVAGLLLGPSLFGHFLPELSVSVFGDKPATPIVILSQIGLILLMFQIGMTFEFGRLGEGRARRSVGPLAVASVGVPFALGMGLGYWSAPQLAVGIPVLVYALFCGVALAITAVPILGRILEEYGLHRHELGVLAIATAAVNDVVGWLLLAGVSAVATATFTPEHSALQLGGVVAFALACWFVLAPAVRWLLARFPIADHEVPPTLMAVVLMGVFAMGMVTFHLGIFAIFGGFAAGLLFHRHAAFVDAWRRQVGRFVLVFFLPIFFTFTGLRTNVLGLTGAADWGWLGLFLAAAILGKIVPVFLAGRACGYDARESTLLGTLMNTRALMELIVLNIGLETGFIPPKVFTMLVIMAVVSTLMTGPALRWLLPRMGLVVPRNAEA